MSKVDPAAFHKYPDGTKLNIDEHNENVFSQTLGRGVFSELNGNVDSENIKPAGSKHLIGSQHIQRGETHRLIQTQGRETLDYWDAAFGQPDFEDAATEDPAGVAVTNDSFVPISGCAARIYLPYDCEMVLWQWSFFATVGRVFSRTIDSDGDTSFGPAPKILHKAFLNGDAIEHTKREFAETHFYKVAIPDYTTSAFTTEGNNARHWDMHHMVTNVSKGWHELDARLFMAQNRGPSLGMLLRSARNGRSSGTGYVPLAHDFFQRNRITFGIRNARAMAMMKTN